jgi:hypothetical protein
MRFWSRISTAFSVPFTLAGICAATGFVIRLLLVLTGNV